jgi:tetratricopeptide (TPR) repeat protein
LLCLLLSASAFAAGHRQRAEAAESTGHAAQAAREYEEAYREEGAPELLYRLGLVRRRLKQYELSKEAFRGYLRAAPEGELGEEVTRQLAELNVLIDEQHRKVPDEEHALTPTPASPIAAPAAAVGRTARATPEASVTARSRRARAAPWMAAGAGALAVGGAALWWDGARVSDDLHARFAAGELDAADGPRYARARRESIAGRALIAGAAVLGAVAVALWW